MVQATIRPYEMSVWTLRDSFIAILKAPGVETKGHVENPQIQLNLDGTENLSFRIPMYYYFEDKYIENPYWYDIQHGLLMVGLRKIKTIFNKGKDKERIYEFLITNVQEEHAEDGSLYCNVEASGLAFQELGKKGTNISLSYDELDAEIAEIEEELDLEKEQYDWSLKKYLQEKEKRTPVPNINYWCDKVTKNLDWSYSIEMEWSLYDGYVLTLLNPEQRYTNMPMIDIGLVNIATLVNNPEGKGYGSLLGSLILGTGRLGWKDLISYKGSYIIPYGSLDSGAKDAVNDLRESLGLRRCDTLYEDSFVKFWERDNEKDKMIPAVVEGMREKQRIIESSESNIYNLTQSIAESFEVYCRYKYTYDENYRIIKKEIIFYNQLLDEYDKTLDLTYSYGAKSITREMDSKDICTKLIVSNMDEDASDSGILSIMNASANKTGENYILNFDYLYNTGAISPDQYNEIAPYELKMNEYNTKLKHLSESINQRAQEINNLKANINLYELSIDQAREEASTSISELKNLTYDEKTKTADGVLEYSSKVYFSNDENGYYINLTEKGIKLDTIKLHQASDTFGESRGIEIDNKNNSHYIIETDNITKLPTRIRIVNLDKNFAWISYQYKPELATEAALGPLMTKIRKDQDNLKKDSDTLEKLENKQKEEQIEYDKKMREKMQAMRDFDALMGPALREGSWKPDSYSNFTSQLNIEANFKSKETTTESEDYIVFWDNELFDDEQKLYYEYGIAQEKIYYPYIKIDSAMLANIYFYLRNDSEKRLYFRYPCTFARTASFQFNENTNKYSFSISSNGPTFSANSEEELSNLILQYGLETYYGINKEETSNCSDSQKKIVCQRYGLKYVEYKYFALGSDMILAFIRQKSSENSVNNDDIIPVLLLIGTENQSDDELAELFRVDGAAPISSGDLGELELVVDMAKEELDDDNDLTEALSTYLKDVEGFTEYSDYSTLKLRENFISKYSGICESEEGGKLYKGNNNYEIVYPRIKIPNFSLNSDNLSIETENNDLFNANLSKLNKFSDYSVLTRTDGYYITFKPERLLDATISSGVPAFFYEDGITYTISAEVSNAELSIYLDAIGVAKNNSSPQVSYEVELSILNTELLNSSYSLLGKIAHINDYELKFENVLGYISSINMNLNNPWEDSIEVQNYKTKFADLFSKIIASTQQMQSNVTLYNKAAAAFSSNGLINTSVLQQSLNTTATSLNIELVKGTLTIDAADGIRAKSDKGIVMMSGGGIYCATNTDQQGNWIWHTGITPNGINASLITTGQLDTNMIRIFAGNNTAFQMNSQGLYAYGLADNGETNQKDYVVYNSKGLFMKKDDVARVEVGWEGFILRNDANEKVFYADSEGNLTLAGTIQASNGLIGGWSIGKNSLTTKDTSTLAATAGMASGLMENGANAVIGSDSLYKVFWAGADVYGNSKFYVESDGSVFANSLVVENSLIANHITLNGVPLEEVLPEVRDVEDGIHITALNGTTFNVLADGTVQEETLQFVVTAHNTELRLDDGYEFNFYIGALLNSSSAETEEDEELNIQYDNQPTETIPYVLKNNSYLTFYINYDIIREKDDLYVKIIYSKNGTELYNEEIYIDKNILSDILTVKIFSSNGTSLRNGQIKDGDYHLDATATILTAHIYRNDEEASSEDYNIQWYKGNTLLVGENEAQLELTIGDILNASIHTYKCIIEEKEQSDDGNEGENSSEDTNNEGGGE